MIYIGKWQLISLLIIIGCLILICIAVVTVIRSRKKK